MTIDALKTANTAQAEKSWARPNNKPKQDQIGPHGRFLVVKQENNSIDHSFDDLEKYAMIEGIIPENDQIVSDDILEDDDDDYEKLRW